VRLSDDETDSEAEKDDDEDSSPQQVSGRCFFTALRSSYLLLLFHSGARSLIITTGLRKASIPQEVDSCRCCFKQESDGIILIEMTAPCNVHLVVACSPSSRVIVSSARPHH